MNVGIDTSSYGFHLVSDLGLGHAGVEVLEGEGRMWWYVDPGTDATARRPGIFAAAMDLFRPGVLPRGTSVFVEEPLVLRQNIKTTRSLMWAGAMVEAALYAARPNVEFHWVDVTVWRKKVLGKGSGRTEEMKQMAADSAAGWLSEKELAVAQMQPDLFDAACICRYGTMLEREGAV